MTYRPREDSLLLKEYLEGRELEDEKVLDMGTGSGILAAAAAEKGGKVVAADVDREALEDAREHAVEHGLEDSIEFVETDLFQDISQRFDLVVFNPPYLPGDRYLALDGGESGTEPVERFLEQVDGCLREGGEAVFVASSRSDIESLQQEFELETLASRKLWFETLYLFKSD